MSKNQRHYEEGTAIRRKIEQAEQKLYRLYRQETKLSGEGEIQVKTASPYGRTIKFKVNMWTSDFKCNGETDTFHVTRNNTYDYRQAVFEDCIDYLCDNLSDEDWKTLAEGTRQDARVICDDYTDGMVEQCSGSDNGSYFCNTFRAQIALFDNDELWEEVREEYGHPHNSSPEDKDCFIRTHLIHQYCLSATVRLQRALQAHIAKKKIKGINTEGIEEE